MLAQKRYAECVNFINAHYLRLSGTPEIVDLYLLVGRAEQARGNTQRVLDAMLTLEGALDEFRGMTREQMLDYLFMRADALQRLGHDEEAVFTIHEFFGMGSSDGRRGAAFVIMGRAYLDQGQVLEAWSAALEAHSLRPIMNRYWTREEGKFYAKAALEIGDQDEAFERLELEVRDQPESEPELVLYLVDAFVAQGRFEKAIMTAALLVNFEDHWGDQARMKTIESMWNQANVANQMASFPGKALQYALAIKDKDLQEKVSELFGKAYEKMGLIDLAAKAYRGILQ
jgi:tetratricopeptide (TPR) repeat protein